MAPPDDENERRKYSHFSHNHPLKPRLCGQTDCETCSGCKKVVSSGEVYYSCKTCNYSLLTACFKMPIVFHHISEPRHDLNLLLLQSFMCRACGLEGSGFCYHCNACDLNYHSLCTRMPLSVSCAYQQHDLKIQFAPPYGQDIGFSCDVCRKAGASVWLYRCSECNFDVHLNCVFAVPRKVTFFGTAPSSPIACGSENSVGKLQSQNSTYSGPVSSMLLGDSPFSRDSRSRILDSLDQSPLRVQTLRLSMEQTLREENRVRNNASSLQKNMKS